MIELVRKPSDQYRNGTGMVDDEHLRVPIAAYETVYIGAWIRVYGQSAAPDFKAGFSVPPGAQTFWSPLGGLHHGPADTMQASNEHITGTAVGWSSGRVGGGEGVRHVYAFGVVVNGPTPGEIALSWAQNTMSADYIGVFQHSCLVVLARFPGQAP